MNTEQELRPDQRALWAAREVTRPVTLSTFTRDEHDILIEDAISAYLAASRSSDEQAEVVGWHVREKSTQWDDCEWTEWRQASDDFAQRLIRDGGKVDDFRIAEVRPVYASPPAVAAGGVTEAEEGATDFGHELQPGAMYANYSHDGNPMTNDRLEWLSRWHPVAEVRVMAGDLWQRRAFDVVRRALAVGDEGIREDDLVTAVWELLRTVHQPTPKAGSDYWHVTAGKHVEFGKLITKLHSLLDFPTPPSRGEGV